MNKLQPAILAQYILINYTMCIRLFEGEYEYKKKYFKKVQVPVTRKSFDSFHRFNDFV